MTFVEGRSASRFLGEEGPQTRREEDERAISIGQGISSAARRKGGASFGCRYTLRPTFLNNSRYLVDPSRKICMRRSRARARARNVYTVSDAVSIPLILIKRGGESRDFTFNASRQIDRKISYFNAQTILPLPPVSYASPVMCFT